MSEEIIIKNPWGGFPLRGYPTGDEWHGFTFISCPCSVVAIKDMEAVTQCVTVKGAKRHLSFLFNLPNP